MFFVIYAGVGTLDKKSPTSHNNATLSKDSDSENEEDDSDEDENDEHKKTHVGITVSTSSDDSSDEDDDSQQINLTPSNDSKDKEKELEKIETPKNLSAIVEKYKPKQLPNNQKDKNKKTNDDKGKNKKDGKTFSSMKKPNGKPQNLEETEDIIETGGDNGQGKCWPCTVLKGEVNIKNPYDWCWNNNVSNCSWNLELLLWVT